MISTTCRREGMRSELGNGTIYAVERMGKAMSSSIDVAT